MKDIYGEKYKGDSPFVADCRRLQSIYRVKIGEAIRPYKGRDGRIHHYGNYISNGDQAKDGCWKNFMTPYAFDYATRRVNNRKKNETINKDRLFNNLLSSQPMAFNLFCPLRQMHEESPETATSIIKAALPMYSIRRVTDVDLEFIPKNPENLTGDKSAMDAIIRFEDENGNPGFVAIETKYSENLGTNAAYDKDEYGNKTPRAQSLEAVKRLECFTPEVEEKIMKGLLPLTQIYRNFLLSEMYGCREGLQSHSIVLAPERHPSTKAEIESLTNGLREAYKDKIQEVHLEDFVDRIIGVCPQAYTTIFEEFKDRYLNFDKLKKEESC